MKNNKRGAGYADKDKADFQREATDDERAGMEWWNELAEAERKHWMRQTGNTGCVADAWATFKLSTKGA